MFTHMEGGSSFVAQWNRTPRTRVDHRLMLSGHSIKSQCTVCFIPGKRSLLSLERGRSVKSRSMPYYIPGKRPLRKVSEYAILYPWKEAAP